jgi:hypothetical protein
VRDKLPVRIGQTAAHFGDLLIGQLNIAAVPHVIEQSARGRILLAVGQLFDLSQRLFKQFCHRSYIALFRRDLHRFDNFREAPIPAYFANGIRWWYCFGTELL